MAKIKFKKEQIPEISENLIQRISLLKNNGAKIVALSGDLGAGKTALVQEIGRQLGVKGKIISPTFVIMKIYEILKKTKKMSSERMIHIDAYRFDSPDELLLIGWEDIIKDDKNLVFIEWPERVKKHIPDNVVNVNIFHAGKEDEGNRYIEFK